MNTQMRPSPTSTPIPAHTRDRQFRSRLRDLVPQSLGSAPSTSRGTQTRGGRKLLGAALSALFVLFAASAAGALLLARFADLFAFHSNQGAFPEAALIQGLDGDLYGTALIGGVNGYGTVFKMTPTGRVTVLHVFAFTDGAYPSAPLLLGTDGNIYGTTAGGGDSSCYNGCGTAFGIARDGTFTTLHSFNSTDGASPRGLVQAIDGSFYGTTAYGGSDDSCTVGSFVGCGTVFKMSATGALTTLHDFSGRDGANPAAAVIQGIDGTFYGTTLAGGVNTFCDLGGAVGCGTVYKMTPSGNVTTLHNFDGNDGANPESALVQTSDGNVYGTTFDGGVNSDSYCAAGPSNSSCGTVFKLVSGGGFSALHRFDGVHGGNPSAALTEGTDGNLYGATVYGGSAQFYGTIFEITTAGALTILHNFSGIPDGGNPYGGLLQSTNGVFYGTAAKYYTFGNGSMFSENVGLGPFVVTVPTARKVGQKVIILGTNLTGATSVAFNGTAATFKVVSPTEITTTVPAGATTGTVQVVTPGGTLKSNVPFRVLP